MPQVNQKRKMPNKPRPTVTDVVQGVFSGKIKLSQAAELLLPGSTSKHTSKEIDKRGETFKQVQDTIMASEELKTRR